MVENYHFESKKWFRTLHNHDCFSYFHLELTDSKGKSSIESEAHDLKYNNDEFDHATDGENREKEEPMDDNDSETETETKDDDHFEDESEDEDVPLVDNHLIPTPFQNVDSIVLLGTEPDRAMVN